MSADFLTKDIIYISSKKRIDGRPDDFTIDFSQQVNVPNSYTHATLLNFACPKTYYLFNSTNNTFNLTEIATYLVTIPVGNYNAATLSNAIIAAINNAGANYTYAISINQTTGKMSYTVSGNGGVQPVFDFSADNGIETILGFNSAAYNFVANVLTSANIINLQLTQTVQLMTNIVKNNVLATIVPNSADFGYILYNEQNPAFSSHELVGREMRAARFWLLDGTTGKHLDLNGQDLNFTFSVFEKNDYFEFSKFDKKMSRIIEDIKES
jgi:hypothetical protein